MTASQGYAGLIHISETMTDQGRWLATSADVPGLFILAPSLKVLRERIPVAVAALYQATYGMVVRVEPMVAPENLAHAENDPIVDVKAWSAQRVAAC